MSESWGFRSAGQRAAIIMPLFMLRSSPFWIVITSLGSIMPVAWADEPPCPSQIPQPLAPGAAAGAATSPSAANAAPSTNTAAAAERATGGNIDVTADTAEAEVGAGKGRAQLRGNVEIRQGDRTIRTDEAEVDRNTGTVNSEGHIDYSDPLVHVTGAGGSYSQDHGA